MRETIIRCDVCKKVLTYKDTGNTHSEVEVRLSSTPPYLERYYKIGANIKWPEVCNDCRKHLAKRFAEAINEIWKEE